MQASHVLYNLQLSVQPTSYVSQTTCPPETTQDLTRDSAELSASPPRFHLHCFQCNFTATISQTHTCVCGVWGTGWAVTLEHTKPCSVWTVLSAHQESVGNSQLNTVSFSPQFSPSGALQHTCHCTWISDLSCLSKAAMDYSFVCFC